MAPMPPREERSSVYENTIAYYAAQSNRSSTYSLASGRFSGSSSLVPLNKGTRANSSDYKPTALRWWFHLSLIVCLAASIGLTQYAISSLGAPHAQSSEMLSNLSKARSIEKTFRKPSVVMRTLIAEGSNHLEEQDTSQNEGGQGSAPKDQFIQLGEVTMNFPYIPRAEPTSNGLDSSKPRVDVTQATTPVSKGLDPLVPSVIHLAPGKITEFQRTRIIQADAMNIASKSGSYDSLDETGGHRNQRAEPTSNDSDLVNTFSDSTLLAVDTASRHSGKVTIYEGLVQRRANTIAATNKPSPSAFDLPSSAVNAGAEAHLGNPYYIHIGEVTINKKRATNAKPTMAISPPGPPAAVPTHVAMVTVKAQTGQYSMASLTSRTSQSSPWLSTESAPFVTIGLIPILTRAVGDLEQPPSTQDDGPHTVQHGTDALIVRRSGGTSGAKLADDGIDWPRDQRFVVSDQAPSPNITMIIVQETRTWPPTVLTSTRTTTNSDGHRTVQTVSSILAGSTLVAQSTLTLSEGQTLVAQPSVMVSTVGGTTETFRSTFTDSEGVHVSTQTIIIGGTPTSTTIAMMVPTSIAEDQQLVTFQDVVHTTIDGETKLTGTTFTNSQGQVTSSFYQTVIGGTPTLETHWTVVASSAPSGETLVTVPVTVPVTVGGTSQRTTMKYTNAQGGSETSTFITALRDTPTYTTLWTVIATPTPTAPSISSNSSRTDTSTDPIAETTVLVLGINTQEYFLAAFLPTILAVLISFPIKLIGINARLMQPFHALTTADQARGSPPEATVFLRFYGWPGMLSFIRAFKLRQPIIAISDMLVLGAGLLAPLAAETIAVYKAFDGCVYYCYGTLGVSLMPGRLLQALMSTLIALLLVLVVLLSVRKWKTGVSQNPWGIASMASLCLNPDIRSILRRLPRGLDGKVREAAILEVLAEKRYGIGYPSASSNFGSSFQDYGVILVNDAAAKSPGTGRVQPNESCSVPKNTSQPFLLLTWWGRCIMLFVFAAIMAILVYYENSYSDSGFEKFMDSQSFGVKFFFTTLGVILGYSMETLFRCVAIMSPYLRLSSQARHAEQSILLSPPTNAFYGMWSAFRQRHLFLGFLSFATVLAELCLPVTLSHVPFSAVETYMTQYVSTYLSVAILGLMMMAVVLSLFVRWPHMPVDPRTIAGAMYYACDSWMLGSLEGMSTLRREDRDLDVRFMRYKYGYGCIEGMSWKSRMGFDIVNDREEAVVTSKRQPYT